MKEQILALAVQSGSNWIGQYQTVQVSLNPSTMQLLNPTRQNC